MNVSSWSIKNPIPSILLFILLSIMGLMSFKAMKIQQFPDIDLPMVTVTAMLPGASPAQMEMEIARKIENSVASLQGVKHIYTKVNDGSASVTVEFRLEKSTTEAVDDVRDAISRIRSDLPGDLLDPIISKVNLSGMPILTYTVASSRMDDEALSWFIDNTVTKNMLSVAGVGAVGRVGGRTRQIQVEIDPDRLLALEATASDVSRQLRQIAQEAPGGRADLGGSEQSIRMMASIQTAEELAAMEITLSDGRHIRLNQIATIKDTVAEQRSAALLNGKPVVGFELTRSRGAGEVEVADGVRAEIKRLEAAHPELTFTEAFNFVDPVEENYEGSMALLLEGALLAVIVVWFFLRDWRATFISATALPLSIIPAFAVMHLLGFTINVITLLSLSLVVGILVDDAIVEIENIMRHLRMGKTPYQAAMEAADEIGLAVIATTFSLIAVFLPTAFMSGVVGKFFVQFGWTAAIAVFFSLVVARMLTPMMAAYILSPLVKKYKEPIWLSHYTRWAAWCLHHRRYTTLAVLIFFVGSFVLAGFLPTGFMPADDMSQTMISIELPPGSTFQQTFSLAEQARLSVQKNPHVKMVYTAVGGGNSGGDPFAAQGPSEARKATLTINLTPRKDRAGVSKQDIEAQLRQAVEMLPGARVKVGLGGNGEKYQLVLASDDGQLLTEYAREVERDLRSIPGIGNVSSSASLVRPELTVRPDFSRAADLGVTSAAIADTLRIATVGDYGQNLAKLNLSQRQVPIVVKLQSDARQDLELLSRLAVPGAHGPVTLGSVAKLEMATGPAQIDRYDRLRNINFEMELNGLPMGDTEQKVLALPAMLKRPPGVIQTPVGDAEAMAELFTGFGMAMATGVLCIYIVLVILFKDFVQPVSILAALVLSIPGAFIGLYLSRTALSMPAMIGLIMLMGIATKNSILLVEYVIMARRNHGMSRWDALLDACMKRARPIVMTTIAMGAGMTPIALGMGTDPSFRSPMAIVVIFGLLTSTFLSLLVVPVVFTYVDDALQWVGQRLGRMRGVGGSLLGLLLVLFLGGCASVGPTYQPPRAEMPDHWSESAAGLSTNGDAVVSRWWTLFEDPLLNSLIQRAMAANQDVRIVETRVREARAMRRLAGAAGVPALGASASALKSRSYENTAGGARDGELYQAGFDAGWEIDVFGGIRRSVESAEAVVDSSVEDQRDVQVSLLAEVARNYLELRGAQQRNVIGRVNITNQEQTVDLLLKQNQLGLGSELALEEARSQLYLTQSQVPGLEAAARQSIFQLALLLGQPPQSLMDELSPVADIPAFRENIPATLPSDLLRRRPDIRRAERQLAAATADIGVATAELFPRFSLGALAGLESPRLSDLVTAGSRFWSLGPTVKWSLFDGGRARAGVEIRNIQRDRAQLVYEKTVLASLVEVEGTLFSYSREQETHRALKAAVGAGQRAASLAKNQYDIGLVDFLNVLLSENALRHSQDQLLQSEQRLGINLVALFKALGGGWELDRKQ